MIAVYRYTNCVYRLSKMLRPSVTKWADRSSEICSLYKDVFLSGMIQYNIFRNLRRRFSLYIEAEVPLRIYMKYMGNINMRRDFRLYEDDLLDPKDFPIKVIFNLVNDLMFKQVIERLSQNKGFFVE